MHRTGNHSRAGSDGRQLVMVAVLLAVATLAGMFLLRPTGRDRPDVNQFGAIQQTYDGRVESVRETDCGGETSPDTTLICQTVTIRILAGPDEGRLFSQQFTAGSGAALAPGDAVVVGRQENAQPGFEYIYVDRQRRTPLFLLMAMFAAAVLLLGRIRGVASLAGLATTFAVLLTFVVPAILDGRSPVAVSLVGAAAIAFVALYMAHGFSRMTTIALMGTLGGLTVTAILAAAFRGLTHITGLASEEARFLQAVGADVNFTGLLLGGVIIGALGAIDDITVTQASAVWELYEANPNQGTRRLFRSGMKIGRDHVASTVNTLALAYFGASMLILMLFVLSNQSLGTVANGEIIATEIFRTLVGSVGLIASVPLTTLLATRFLPASPSPGERTDPGQPPEETPRGEELELPDRRWEAFLGTLRGRTSGEDERE